jgi:hypothetical protein
MKKGSGWFFYDSLVWRDEDDAPIQVMHRTGKQDIPGSCLAMNGEIK